METISLDYKTVILTFAGSGEMSLDVELAIVEMLKYRNIFSDKPGNHQICKNLKEIVDLSRDVREAQGKGIVRLTVEGVLKAALLTALSAVAIFFFLEAISGYILCLPLFFITASLYVSLTYEWAPISVQKWIDGDNPHSLEAMVRGILVASVGGAFAIANIFYNKENIQEKEDQLAEYTNAFLTYHKNHLTEMFEV